MLVYSAVLDALLQDANGHARKRFVPGCTSYAKPRELMRWLLALEEGRRVDAWSSREIKRLLYVTERRNRYVSSPALDDAEPVSSTARCCVRRWSRPISFSSSPRSITLSRPAARS
ncbi:MAG: hypothetical protein ACK4UX_09985 [Thiobacillus sp.]